MALSAAPTKQSIAAKLNAVVRLRVLSTLNFER